MSCRLRLDTRVHIIVRKHSSSTKKDSVSPPDLLRHNDLFAALPDESRQPLAKRLQRRVFAKDMILFHKGSPGLYLYIVESGLIRIFVASDLGQELSLAFYGPGEWFGEMSLLDGLPRSAGAITLEASAVHVLHRRDFLDILDQQPQICRHLLATVSKRMRGTIAFAEGLAFLDVSGRVAMVLLQFAERFGEPGEHVEIGLRLTQSELASCVSTSRERINRVLGTFRDRGFIRIEGKTIIILDADALRQYVDY